MRLPIAGTKERYETGIMEIHGLLSEGKTEDEVVHALNNKYTERDIRGLTGRIKMMYEMKDYPQLKMILKVLLWFFLAMKVLSGISLILEYEVILFWAVFMILLIPAFNILSLVLVYKETDNAYLSVFMLGVLSFTMGSGEFSVMTENNGDIVQMLSILNFIPMVLLIVISFILYRRCPADLLRIRKIFKKNNLMVGASE